MRTLRCQAAVRALVPAASAAPRVPAFARNRFLLAVLLGLLGRVAQAGPLGTAFTYQGRLSDGGNAANGTYEFQFQLFDAALLGDQIGVTHTNAVTVSNGLFTTTLNFGAGAFSSGEDRWLRMGVRTNGSAAAFEILAPRQLLTPTPFARYAEDAGEAARVPADGLMGTVPDARLSTNVALLNQPAAFAYGVSALGFGGNGGQLSNLNASALAFGYVPDDRLGGNVARLNGSATFLGTLGTMQDLEAQGDVFAEGDVLADRLNIGQGHLLTAWLGSIAGGLNHTSRSDFSSIGGGLQNTILTGGEAETIAGGRLNLIETAAHYSFIGGGAQNAIRSAAQRSAILGGSGNTIHTNADYAVIGGGEQNEILPAAHRSFLGSGFANGIEAGSSNSVLAGGYDNRIGENSPGSTVGGGTQNRLYWDTTGATIGGGLLNYIKPSAHWGTIAGGTENEVRETGRYGAVGGGANNLVSGFYGAVPGGRQNEAGGLYSFAAGRRAAAMHPGAFVWADATDAAFSSTTNDQFLIRASGGVGINTNNPKAALHVAGGVLAVAFAGSGLGLSNLNAASLLVGTVPDERLSTNVALLVTNAAFGGDLGALRLNIGTGHSLAGAKASIAGGQNNTNSSPYAVIAGGQNNTILSSADASLVAGGGNNTIYPDADYSAIGGGRMNLLEDNVNYAVIAGGFSNTVLANISYAAIPGGGQNLVAGNYGFAAGRRAKALHGGAFVWADSTDADFASTAAKQFLIRAAGGVGIGTSSPTSALHVAGTATADAFAGGGAGLTGLNADSLASGTVPDARLGTNVALLSGAPTFAGLVTAPGFAGGGFFLTNLNASKLAFGTVPDARLSANVALLNTGAAFAGTVSAPAFSGSGAALTNLNATNLAAGTVPDARLSSNVALLSGSPTFAGTVTAGGDVVGARLRVGSNLVIAEGHNTIVGGNYITNLGDYGTALGGFRNAIQSGAWGATLGGGEFNVIEPSTECGTLAGGSGNVIQSNAQYAAIAGGRHAKARLYGQVAHAAGRFASTGDAQTSFYVLRGVTTNGTNQAVLALDGYAQALAPAPDTTWTFFAQISARSSSGDSAGYEIRGVIENAGGDVKFVGLPVITTLGEDIAAWQVLFSDSWGEALSIFAYGSDGATVRWVATVQTTEVTY